MEGGPLVILIHFTDTAQESATLNYLAITMVVAQIAVGAVRLLASGAAPTDVLMLMS